MKRLLKTAAAALILMAVFSACANADAALPARAMVSNPNPADRLNLRERPGADSNSLGRYYNGTPVNILSSAGGPWLYVSVGGEGLLSGYMDSRYLAFEGTAAYAAVQTAMPEYAENSTSWTLYDAPGYGAGRRLFGSGNRILLMGFTSDWWHIRVIGPQGGTAEGFVPAGTLDALTVAVVSNPNPADRLNLRESPDASAASLGKYYNGVQVEILASAGDGGADTWKWVRIMGTDVTGYMQTQYLERSGMPVASAMPTAWIRNASGTGLNLRADTSTRAASLGLYANGTQVTVMGITPDWYHVQIDGKTGYMLAEGMTPSLAFDLGR